MPKVMKSNVLGAWAFLIGVILAVIVGLLDLGATEGTWAIILVILGIIIGLLNISSGEIKQFMMAGTILVIVSVLGGQTMFSVAYVGAILQALVVLVVPITVIVALKSVFALAKS